MEGKIIDKIHDIIYTFDLKTENHKLFHLYNTEISKQMSSLSSTCIMQIQLYVLIHLKIDFPSAHIFPNDGF